MHRRALRRVARPGRRLARPVARVRAAAGELGAQDGSQHFERMRRLLRENGVNHSLAGSPEDRDGHWELDPIPWLLAGQEWRELSAGLAQRAELLNRVLADLYGPQELLRRGLIPPELVFRQAGFLLPCHGLAAPRGIFLHLYAGELVRGPDGRWRVLADRTQGPTGRVSRSKIASCCRGRCRKHFRTCRSSGWRRSS